MTKRGRPPKQRTAIEPLAPAAWMRILQGAAGEAKDPRLGTEIGRLCAAGRMTATEATAAFRVAEIYGRYERLAGLKRMSRSPSYEVGYGGGRGSALVEGENDVQIVMAWHALQDLIPIWPADRRKWLEELCVENLCIGPIELEQVRELLQHLAIQFRITSAPRNSPPVKGLNRPPVKKKSTAATKLPPSDLEREALCVTLLKANPNLPSSQLLGHIDFYFTWKERERFRREKANATRKL